MVLRICKSFAIILISPYSVYVVSEILCTVTGYSYQGANHVPLVARVIFRTRYLLSVPFCIQTPTHPYTSHPLHSLEHYIYFHDLPFSLLSTLVYLQHLQNFWCFSWRLLRTRAGLWNDGASDPDCCITVGVMFWFACFSVVFFNHEIYIRRGNYGVWESLYVIIRYRTVII